MTVLPIPLAIRAAATAMRRRTFASLADAITALMAQQAGAVARRLAVAR
jgi:hypothetical protein